MAVVRSFAARMAAAVASRMGSGHSRSDSCCTVKGTGQHRQSFQLRSPYPWRMSALFVLAPLCSHYHLEDSLPSLILPAAYRSLFTTGMLAKPRSRINLPMGSNLVKCDDAIWQAFSESKSTMLQQEWSVMY